MTTYDPTMPPGFVGWLMARRASKQRARRITVESLPIAGRYLLAVTRFLMHLVGFSALTFAGFTFSIAAGLITGAACLFVFSWLISPSTVPTDNLRR